jgi:hypothetical protein
VREKYEMFRATHVAVDRYTVYTVPKSFLLNKFNGEEGTSYQRLVISLFKTLAKIRKIKAKFMDMLT